MTRWRDHVEAFGNLDLIRVGSCLSRETVCSVIVEMNNQARIFILKHQRLEARQETIVYSFTVFPSGGSGRIWIWTVLTYYVSNP